MSFFLAYLRHCLQPTTTPIATSGPNSCSLSGPMSGRSSTRVRSNVGKYGIRASSIVLARR